MEIVKVPPPVQVQPIPVLSVPLRKYFDQCLDGVATPLDPAELKTARARFEQAHGGKPEPESKPTAEQLAALQTVVLAGRAPYADFAVWNIWGPRLAKHQDSDSTVLVGRTWVTKRIQAPSSFVAWQASWDLFEVAMISLGHASYGALSRYSKGIAKLSRLFPGNWDIILATDLLVRSERWAELRETYGRTRPDGFSEDHPGTTS